MRLTRRRTSLSNPQRRQNKTLAPVKHFEVLAGYIYALKMRGYEVDCACNGLIVTKAWCFVSYPVPISFLHRAAPTHGSWQTAEARDQVLLRERGRAGGHYHQ